MYPQSSTVPSSTVRRRCACRCTVDSGGERRSRLARAAQGAYLGGGGQPDGRCGKEGGDSGGEALMRDILPPFPSRPRQSSKRHATPPPRSARAASWTGMAGTRSLPPTRGAPSAIRFLDAGVEAGGACNGGEAAGLETDTQRHPAARSVSAASWTGTRLERSAATPPERLPPSRTAVEVHEEGGAAAQASPQRTRLLPGEYRHWHRDGGQGLPPPLLRRRWALSRRTAVDRGGRGLQSAWLCREVGVECSLLGRAGILAVCRRPFQPESALDGGTYGSPSVEFRYDYQELSTALVPDKTQNAQ